MSNKQQSQRFMVLWVICGLLLLFFLVTAALALQMRTQLRQPIVNRDGEIFMAVASAEVDQVRTVNEGIIPAGADEELFEVALNTSEIEGVIGVRVFTDGDEAVGGIPIAMKRGNLSPEEERVLKQRTPISRFHAAFLLSEIFLLVEEESAESPTYPVLEIIIPLFSLSDDEVSGFAQYYLDGSAIAQELSEVDKSIATYAGGAFLFGGVLGSGILFWAFRRLRKVNQLLEDRTRHLVSANHKLSMEARTAAIGAITSHLIHGLKSPLQGIRQFVSAHSNGDAEDSQVIWQDAADTTERMQNLINEVIEVLQDRGGDFSYEVSVEEVASLTRERVVGYAERNAVLLSVEGVDGIDDLMISNDRANLIVLILVNLIRNAVDASREGDTVSLSTKLRSGDRLSFSVVDRGKGLPESVREHLFEPVSSSKEGGSGVGLSLCQELSRHLGGELELARSGPDGTVFELNISIIT